MTRRNFIGMTAAAATAAVLPDILKGQASPEKIVLKNRQFELLLNPGKGLDCRLTHVLTGRVLAKGPYFYSFGAPAFRVTSSDPSTVCLSGLTASGIEVSHRFHLSPDKPWIEEDLSIRNSGAQPLILAPRCGFLMPASLGTLDGYRFTAVPYRREPTGDRKQYADYSLHQILHDKRLSVLRGSMKWGQYVVGGVTQSYIEWEGKPPLAFDVYASEGWAITDGQNGFLVTKYNPTAMEWTLLDGLEMPDGRFALRWGGAGSYEGDPEPACALGPGESFRFGTTRLTAFNGEVANGFYAFRNEMESRGHRAPAAFNPPVHWNELYDNKLWWLPPEHGFNDLDMRRRYYSLKDMEEAAAKAKEMGCEALYMDPGWDTNFASKIWDEARLGTLASYVESMRSKYGLKVSLHTPLSGWSDPTSYPLECCRVDRAGVRDKISLCGTSTQYVNETFRRLDRLGDDGVCFFMFDGPNFNGPCWDPTHGHSVPSTRHEHVRATNHLAVLVHGKHPDVLIEMHDQIVGCVPARYVPTYLGHGRDADGSRALGFDSVWAFELMWKSMENLIAGNSICLYYYNLAYSMPLYLHIDLRTDNAEALMFWWNASTCRHLGIGGTHKDPAIREAQKQAMATYLRLKPYFTAGVFYGIDEMTHVHRHPSAATAVINCFNVDPSPVAKRIVFDPVRFGLPEKRDYRFTGAEFALAGETYSGSVSIPAFGHRLIEVI